MHRSVSSYNLQLWQPSRNVAIFAKLNVILTSAETRRRVGWRPHIAARIGTPFVVPSLCSIGRASGTGGDTLFLDHNLDYTYIAPLQRLKIP